MTLNSTPSNSTPSPSSHRRITHCKRCLYPSNHPLGLNFDSAGLCMGCHVHDEKDRLDWREREQRLRAILKAYRGRGSYDCVVPVSGGRDSFFIADQVIRRYGLNPLFLSFNRHYNTYAGIFNLEQLRSQLGADIVTQTLNPEALIRLTRLSLKRLGSLHWPYLAGSTVFPIQVAVRRRIPLIIWGAHQGLEQVGMFSHLDEVEMTRRYRREHDLMGLEPEDAVGLDPDVSEADLAPLFYPEDRLLAAVGIRGIYLGNYLRWDVKAQHEAMLDRYDYCVVPQPRTFDTYSDVDCLLQGGLHDRIKLRKWGYGKATDHACREIRFGRLTREQGAALAHHYQACDDNGPLESDTRFARWLGLTAEEMWSMIHRQALSPAPPADLAGASETKGDQPESCLFRINQPPRMARGPFDPALLMRGDASLPEEKRVFTP